MSRIILDARQLRSSSGRYVDKLIHNLQKLDKVNDYFILLKPEDIDSLQLDDKKFKKISCPYKEFTFSEQLNLLKQIRNLKPDLVHFTFPQQPALFKGKKITTVHDLTTLRFNNPDKNMYIFKTKQKIFSYLIKKVSKDSNSLITPSIYVKKDLINFTGINENKVSVIYEAADKITAKSEKINYLENIKFIMYIGRPNPHKNLENLIKAYQKQKKDGDNIALVLAGKEDNNFRRIKNIVKSDEIEDVFFTGFVNESQLRWLYENCLAYVFPSLSEGFGLPGLEAMAHGAPVVSSNATCLPEIYGDAALYFDPLNVNDMADKINQILINQKLRDKLIKLGFDQVKKYSWQHMAKQTLELYSKILVAS